MRDRMFGAGVRYVCVVGLAFAGAGQMGESLVRSLSHGFPSPSATVDRPLSRVEAQMRAKTVIYSVAGFEQSEPELEIQQPAIPVAVLVAGLERAEAADLPVTDVAAAQPPSPPASSLAANATSQGAGVFPVCQKPKCIAAQTKPASRLARGKTRSKDKATVAATAQAKSRSANTAQTVAARANENSSIRNITTAQLAQPVRGKRWALNETPETLMRRGLLGHNS